MLPSLVAFPSCPPGPTPTPHVCLEVGHLLPPVPFLLPQGDLPPLCHLPCLNLTRRGLTIALAQGHSPLPNVDTLKKSIGQIL